jgi:GAF domain-containing protein
MTSPESRTGPQTSSDLGSRPTGGTGSDPFDPTGLFADLSKLLSDRRDYGEILHDIAEVAVQRVPGAEDCSVTLTSGTSAFSPASAGDLARRLDENQFNLGQGPCLDAGTSGETLIIGDVDEDDRWPAYLSLATVIGLGSSVSVPLPLQQEFLGALNFYSRTPHAFDTESIHLCERLAAHVAAVLSQARMSDSVDALAEQLLDSSHARAVVEQAKGILMAARRCTSQDAFEHLRRIAQNEKRHLEEVAASLVSQASGHPVS